MLDADEFAVLILSPTNVEKLNGHRRLMLIEYRIQELVTEMTVASPSASSTPWPLMACSDGSRFVWKSKITQRQTDHEINSSLTNYIHDRHRFYDLSVRIDPNIHEEEK
jgi:hypothetical protein